MTNPLPLFDTPDEYIGRIVLLTNPTHWAKPYRLRILATELAPNMTKPGVEHWFWAESV